MWRNSSEDFPHYCMSEVLANIHHLKLWEFYLFIFENCWKCLTFAGRTECTCYYRYIETVTSMFRILSYQIINAGWTLFTFRFSSFPANMLFRNIPPCQRQSMALSVCVCISLLCAHSQAFVPALCAVQEDPDSWDLPNPQSCLTPSSVGRPLSPPRD